VSLKENNTTKLHHFTVIFRTLATLLTAG